LLLNPLLARASTTKIDANEASALLRPSLASLSPVPSLRVNGRIVDSCSVHADLRPSLSPVLSLRVNGRIVDSCSVHADLRPSLAWLSPGLR